MRAATENRRGRSKKKRATPPPAVNEPLAFINFVAAYSVGSTVEGEVVSFTSHGAMVDVAIPGDGGLHCYIPLMAMGTPPPTKARQVLKKGEVRSFVLAGLDPPRRVAELALPAASSPAASARGGPTEGKKTAAAKKASARQARCAGQEGSRQEGGRRQEAGKEGAGAGEEGGSQGHHQGEERARQEDGGEEGVPTKKSAAKKKARPEEGLSYERPRTAVARRTCCRTGPRSCS